jgi:hypothetical protein
MYNDPIVAKTIGALLLCILAAAVLIFVAWAMVRTGIYMFSLMLEQARRQIRRGVDHVDA